MALDKSSSSIQVAVIEGAHPFDVPGWHALFRSYGFIDYYPQPIENWLADWGRCRNDYDVTLFYNMNMNPKDDPLSIGVGEALEAYTQAGGGVFIMHHALIAFPENATWMQAVGLPDRSLDYFVDQEVTVDCANAEHPISAGMALFSLVDETYTLKDAAPEDGNTVVFTAVHEKSMHTLGWTRQMNASRVFCFQPGHDNRVWTSPAFREVIGRAITWLAGK